MDFELEDPPSAPKPQSTVKVEPQIKSAKKVPEISTDEAPRQHLLPWKKLRLLSRAALYAGFALYLSGTYFVSRFDDKLEISPSVRRDPIQTPIREDVFPFEYRGHHYEIQPVADYEISGLVVTHNEISSITDAYHTSDSVDFRDICLVWGANVGSGIFRRYKFFSMPWSCHYQPLDRNAELVEDQVSNNHLLAADESVRKTIVSMHIGDQVQLKGKLINYWQKEHPEYKRRTSLVREDTGNGACEVLWVESAKILRAGGTNWHLLQSVGKWLLFAAVGLGAFLFLFTPLGQYRRFKH
jgi:hypothetical protein